MAHYAWTIKAKGRQDVAKVTTLAELEDVLRVLDLPGLMPADWVVMLAESPQSPDHGHYVHNEDGDDQWSLTWTKVGTGEA